MNEIINERRDRSLCHRIRSLTLVNTSYCLLSFVSIRINLETASKVI